MTHWQRVMEFLTADTDLHLLLAILPLLCSRPGLHYAFLAKPHEERYTANTFVSCPCPADGERHQATDYGDHAR